MAAGTVLDTRESAIELVRPATLAQLQAAVRQAAERGEQVRPLTASNEGRPARAGVTIDLRNLRGLVHVDAAAGTATFLAGTTIDQAATELEAHGLSLVGAPSDAKLTLGDGVTLGGHSGCPRDASFPASIAGLTLVDHTGELLRITASRNSHLWGAARLSLGALGIVVDVTVRVRKYQALRVKRVRRDLGTMLREMPEAHRKVDYYQAVWRPGHDAAKLTLGWLEDSSPAAVAARRSSLSSVLDAGEHKPGFFARLRDGVRRLIGGGAERVAERRDGAGALAEGRDVAVAGTGGVVMEYQFPLYRTEIVLQGLHELASHNRAFGGIRARLSMVARDDVWMSPAYGQDVAAIALEVSDSSGRNLEALQQAEELFIYLGGLPNWAGWSTFNAAEAADVMPRYSDFTHIAHDLDPYGLFGNAVADRVVH